MALSRRDFFKYGGATAAGVLVGGRALDLGAVESFATSIRIKEAKAFPGVCPYCAVGCAQLIYVKDGKIIDIEGDPNTPHTEGHSARRDLPPISCRSTSAAGRRRCIARRAATSGRRSRWTG